MKNPPGNESVDSNNEKIQRQPPESKLMYTLRCVMKAISFIQGVRQLIKWIKEWADPS